MLSSLIAKAPFPDVRRISDQSCPFPPPLLSSLFDSLNAVPSARIRLPEDNFSVWFERGKAELVIWRNVMLVTLKPL